MLSSLWRHYWLDYSELLAPGDQRNSQSFFSPQWQDSRAKGSNFLITELLQWHSGLIQQTPSIAHLFSMKGTYQRLQELQALNTRK